MIRALNDDKPWDEFLVEQLAGDELLAPPYANLTPEQADQLDRHRLPADGARRHRATAVDQNVARNDVVAETIKIVSTSLLGLTVGCAQCHDHRYDPISQADYYRMRAMFEPAYDWKNWRAPDARLVSLVDGRNSPASGRGRGGTEGDCQASATKSWIRSCSETFERELAKLPAEMQPTAEAAAKRRQTGTHREQKQLIKEYPFLNVDRGSVYLYLPDRLTGFNKKWDELTRTDAEASDRPTTWCTA